MPEVTDCDKASGLPIAKTGFPPAAFPISPSARGRVRRIQLNHGDVGERVAADEFRFDLLAVGKRAGNPDCIGRDVMIRHNVTIRRNNHAAAVTFGFGFAPAACGCGHDVNPHQTGPQLRRRAALNPATRFRAREYQRRFFQRRARKK